MIGIQSAAWGICLHVVSRGLPPIVHWDRDHFSNSVGHLFRHLIDVTVLLVCILFAVDRDVFCQGDFFVGPENMAKGQKE